MNGDPAGCFVLVHGGSQGSWVWQEVMAALRLQNDGKAIRLLALDVPGCGVKRGRDVSGLSFNDVVEELAADLDAASVTGAVAVGHSQAGILLPALSAVRPQMFRRLVYVTCCAPSPGQTVRELMGTGLHDERPDEVGWAIPRATASLSELLDIAFCNDMTPAQRAAFEARLGGDTWPEACAATYRDWRYDTSGPPSTFVVALADKALPPPWQYRFAERLGAEHIVRIDAAHQAMQTRPHALAEVLLSELARPRGATTRP